MTEQSSVEVNVKEVEAKRMLECERKLHEREECRGSPWCRYCVEEDKAEEKH
jgi:hypothetical protein